MNLARSAGDRVLDAAIILLLILITVVTLYPLYLVLISSVSNPTLISSGQVYLIPKGFNIDAYKKLLDTSQVWIGYRNSLFYMIVGTMIQMLVTVSAGFALSRRTLPGRAVFTVFFIVTMYVNGGMIPMYILMRDLRLLNRVWALLLPEAMNVYHMIIARSYFENGIPEEIYESVYMDGGDMFRCYWQFAIPLAKPMLAVLALYFALGHWNSYMNAMIYITDDKIQTLQVIIKRITVSVSNVVDSISVSTADQMQSVQQTQLLKYAVVVVSSVPMILLYPFVQRYLIQGMMIGAVKG